MRPGPGLLALILVLAAGSGAPAQALEVCRENALGQVACTGTPTHGLDPITPFATPEKSGLSRVQRQPRDLDPAPKFLPSTRTNSFGDTVIGPADSRPPRPRTCVPDAFGNLRC